MIFAYIFNPLISFFYHKFHIPRALSIIIVYFLLIVSVILFAFFITRALIGESVDLADNISRFLISLKIDIAYLPEWIQPYARDYTDFLSKNQFNIVSISPFPLFTRALSGILSIFVTLFAAFFFLKDNRRMLEKIKLLLPEEYRDDSDVLLRRINLVLSSYLRGQIIIILSMVAMLFTSFWILGVKYALTISVLVALFEIVPIMGPIVAGILGTIIILITGGSRNFLLNPSQTVIIVAAIFYITRQIQDYIIAPYVIGKSTKLHPLIILFSVLVGQHIYGIIGVLLAVPLAATLKILYEFVLERIREEDLRKQLLKKPQRAN